MTRKLCRIASSVSSCKSWENRYIIWPNDHTHTLFVHTSNNLAIITNAFCNIDYISPFFRDWAHAQKVTDLLLCVQLKRSKIETFQSGHIFRLIEHDRQSILSFGIHTYVYVYFRIGFFSSLSLINHFSLRTHFTGRIATVDLWRDSHRSNWKLNCVIKNKIILNSSGCLERVTTLTG